MSCGLAVQAAAAPHASPRPAPRPGCAHLRNELLDALHDRRSIVVPHVPLAQEALRNRRVLCRAGTEAVHEVLSIAKRGGEGLRMGMQRGCMEQASAPGIKRIACGMPRLLLTGNRLLAYSVKGRLARVIKRVAI